MSLTEAESQAAASVAAAFVDDFAGTQPPAVEAPAEVSSPEVDDTADTAPSFEYAPELPEDLARELQEAEIDNQVETELAAYIAPPDDGDDVYAVDETVDDRRDRIRLQKRNEYLEAELAKTRGTVWKAEALKYFPLAEHVLDDIKATSRRGFLREAKAEHDRLLPHVQKVLGEAKQFVDAEKQSARQEGKDAAKAAFGEPLSGPDVATVEQAASEAALQAARDGSRRSGSLVNVFKELIKQGK